MWEPDISLSLLRSMLELSDMVRQNVPWFVIILEVYVYHVDLSTYDVSNVLST
jgi:hypothetical protein